MQPERGGQMPALAERMAAAFQWMPEGGLSALVQKAEDAADTLSQVVRR